jgi:ribosomal protein L12E/L44/L45/RPP1/RPP2
MDAKIIAWLEQVYSSNKILFYSVIPLLGILLAVIKFRNILITLLIKNSKDILTNAEKTDAGLAQQANQNKQQADQAAQQGDQEASKEPPTEDDWNQK